jgi:hypothetical protein
MLDVQLIPDLVCGRTNRDDRAEQITRTVREQQGYRIDGGCGRPMTFVAGYRCAECGRWMHLDCLRGHFAESRHDECIDRRAALAGSQGGGGEDDAAGRRV